MLNELTIIEKERLVKLAQAAKLTRKSAVVPSITLARRAGRLALSFAQRRLWFLAQMEGASRAYHVSFGFHLRGELEEAVLRRALDRIIERHESLRTTFASVDGEPEQRLAPAGVSRFHLLNHDLSQHIHAQAELDHLIEEEIKAPFDLQMGPLVRGRLVRQSQSEYTLLITMHHIVSDGWSIGLFVKELSSLYQAYLQGAEDPLAPLAVQYADYAVWQQEWVESGVLKKQGQYWKEALTGVPALLEVPADHPRPAQQDYAGDCLRFVLDEKLTAGLRGLTQRHGTTLYMMLLAGWAALLSRLSRQQDLVIGSPAANRGQLEIEGLIGFFVNMLPVRLNLEGLSTVGTLLEHAKAQAIAAQQHQDTPFEQIVELTRPPRNSAYHPLIQVTFAWQNTPRTELSLPGLETKLLRSVPHFTTAFDLALFLEDAQATIIGRLDYAIRLFERSTIKRYLGYFQRLLEGMVAEESHAVDRLPLLGKAERRQVLHEWNASTAEYPSEECIQQLFAEQVERTPNATAVVCEEESLSYRELNRRANQLGHYLRKMGVGPDSRVAICVERGLEMIVGLLGVLKAGGAYVPLDPSYPPERLRFMLEDSAPVVLLTQGHLEGLFTGVRECLAVLDVTAAATWQEQPDTDLECASVGLTSEHLAYVIYTSGSTGQPKGVMVEHQGVVRLVRNTNYVQLGTEDVVAQASNVSFDAATFEIWGALLAGARLVIISKNALLSRAVFGQELRQNRINTLFLTTALFNEVAREAVEAFAGLRYLLFGGEEVETRWVARVLGEAKVQHLLHVYGPTETVTFATWHEVRTVEEGRTVPIGRPIANTRVYILDANLEPAPVGVAGELYIGGPGVARGYWQRVELTAERFVKDPFVEEAGTGRMYRTGDLGRWLPDGTIEFIGRNDQQVKLRGFRIELGEIEARLAEHPGVGAAVVVAREDVPGEKRLVAYYTRVTSRAQEETEEKAGPEQLRAHLAARLPEYMVPAAYVQLESLPLTRNGKIDRKELPAPEGDAYATRGYLAPEGELENLLAGIWQELLRVEGVGRHDNFFELGGHSLLAMRVITRIRQVLSVEVTISDLFAHPVLADLARAMESAAHAELPPITHVERVQGVPLSFAQQRLWFLSQIEGLSEAYHISFGLRLAGELDHAALGRALDRIVERHEVLRTIFIMAGEEPVQRIIPAGRFHLLEHDLQQHDDALAELERLAAEEAINPFNLETGPLIRGRLIRQARDEHTLLITMHHIVSDGWSMGVLIKELNALYGAFLHDKADPLPELSLQYADYAVWQRQWIEGEILRRQAEYWKNNLSGAPEVLQLPADHLRPAAQNYAGEFVELVLDKHLTFGLKELGRRQGATLYMTLLAGWAALLSRLSGQQDVVVGSPVANRGRAEIEGLIGFFVNTLALRLDVGSSPTVSEFLARVKTQALAAQQNQDTPFEQVVELARPVRSLAHSPVFQVMFAWENAPEAEVELPGLRVTPLRSALHRLAKFDLTLSLRETGETIAGGLTYATAMLERPTIERYLGYFRSLLEGMVADDSQTVDRLPLLGEAERRQVLYQWNGTEAEYPGEKCVHQLFAEQVERTPNATAVVFAEESLTYADLNRRANQLGHYLRKMGVGPEVRVGICVERSLEMIIGVLGTMKAGGAYVPLDPEYPQERLRYMLQDAQASVLLVQPEFAWTLSAEKIPVVLLHRASDFFKHESEDDLSPLGSSDNLAYVIYTSGSSGRPKGVLVSHRSIVHHLHWRQRTFPLGQTDRFLHKASLSFDISVWEIFAPLLNGAQLVVAAPKAQGDPAYLTDLIVRANISVAHFNPGLLGAFLEEPKAAQCRSLKRVFCGGERMPPELPRQFFSVLPAELHNQYGPTETTVDVLFWSCQQDDQRQPVPLGRPIDNTTVYVLDSHQQAVPLGVPGELYVGGISLARGYLGRPGLTAERFVPNPFAKNGERLYRTGDRVRWRADGNLEFLGRVDHQVKLRGYRIELGEIEAALLEHSEVEQAAVVMRENQSGEKRLAGYVVREKVGEEESRTDCVSDLQEYLRGRLPEYMVPGVIVELEAMPLTPSGKLDRNALPAPQDDAYGVRGHEAPLGEVEMVLAGIWSELLRVERAGRQDNFFDLGGHSLLAVRAAARIRSVLGVELPIGEFFARPRLMDLAASLKNAKKTTLPPIWRADRCGSLPLSFAQQRLWFLDQLGAGASGQYNMSRAFRLRGQLDHNALEKAINTVVERHEVLRTHFIEVNGAPEQVIEPGALVEVPMEDLTGLEEEARQRHVLEILRREAIEPFDLRRGPVMRIKVLKLAQQEHILVRTMHHIVSDGWSEGVFDRECKVLYSAYSDGRENPFEPLTIQYADFATWQRRWAEEGALDEGLRYWKEQLAGIPDRLELPADQMRPAMQTYRGSSRSILLSKELSAALRRLGTEEGVTLFMVLLACFQLLLSRWSGQTDVVVGTPIVNRNLPELEELIGFFMNTLALRTRLASELTLRQLLQRVREVCLAAYKHQEVPFEQLVTVLNPERDLSRNPLFQVMLNVMNFPRRPFELEGIEIEMVKIANSAQSKFDLTLYAKDEERIPLTLVYNSDLFADGRMAEFLEQFESLLTQAVRFPEGRIGDYSLINSRWSAKLPDPTANLDGRVEETIVNLFARQALARRSQAAIIGPEGTCTYGELDEMSSCIARSLLQEGLTGEVVAVYARRNAALIHCLMGICKAGAIFLILDAEYPPLRVAQYLNLARPAAFLDCSGEQALPVGIEQTLQAIHLRTRMRWYGDHLEIPESKGEGARACEPEFPRLNPQARAYITFTSGSTGEPKAVSGTHAPLTHFVEWYWRRFGLTTSDHFAMLSGLSHDPLLRDIFVPLSIGATLCIPDGEVAYGQGLSEWLAESVTVVHLTPSLARSMRNSTRTVTIPSLRCLCLGGEPVTYREVAWLRELAPQATIVNFYGATETPQAMGYWIAADSPADTALDMTAPLGNGIDHVQLLVLNDGYKQCGIGELGEIYVRTPHLTLGYHGDSALTDKRYLQNPFTSRADDRIYRTGDLGRYNAAGQVEYSGRVDDQVKIRGFRIELGEVETVLRTHEQVQDAVVIVRADERGERRLVGYVVSAPGEKVDGAMLRSYLQQRLPEFMVPAAIVVLEKLPLTPNRKLDKTALPAPEYISAAEYRPPCTPEEKILCSLFAEVLGLEHVGLDDNFFELGGHSLLALRVISRVRDVFQVEAPLRILFEHSTVEAFAAAIRRLTTEETEEKSKLKPIERIAPGTDPPLACNVAGYLAFESSMWMKSVRSGAFHSSLAFWIEGALDAVALEQSLNAIIQRHEIWRAGFRRLSNGPNPSFKQIIHANAALKISSINLENGSLAERENEALRMAIEERARAFDYEAPPLLRASLLRVKDGKYLFMLVIHHLLSDGWSLNLLKKELKSFYSEFAEGVPACVPELPIQYADFGHWQRKSFAEGAFAGMLAFWRKQWAEYESGFIYTRELPFAKAASGEARHGASPVVIEFDDGVQEIRSFARKNQLTLFMLFIACVNIVLHFHTGKERMALWGRFANRVRKETENLIGWFANSHLIGVTLSPSISVLELLQRVRRAVLEANSNQELPSYFLRSSFFQDRQDCDLSRLTFSGPDVWVGLNTGTETLSLGQLNVYPVANPRKRSEHPLNLMFGDSPDYLGFVIHYDVDIFPEDCMRNLGEQLANTMKWIVRSPQAPVGTIVDLLESHAHQLSD